MDKTKQNPQATQLNKALASLLNGFEKSKAWTDIGAWLFKVEQAMKDFPSPFISEKLALAKRLAQCLNPGLHQAINMQSLKIYELIFENIKQSSQGNIEEYKKMFCEDIGIYSVGLFPFFQNAHQKNKHYFLEVIRNYYLPVGRDLIPCVPGLVLAILPGLEEQSEALTKDVTKTLEGIMQACGRRYFIGSIWMGIMRCQRGREHAIKFLMKYIPKMKNDDDEEGDDDDQEGNNDTSNLSDDERIDSNRVKDQVDEKQNGQESEYDAQPASQQSANNGGDESSSSQQQSIQIFQKDGNTPQANAEEQKIEDEREQHNDSPVNKIEENPQVGQIKTGIEQKENAEQKLNQEKSEKKSQTVSINEAASEGQSTQISQLGSDKTGKSGSTQVDNQQATESKKGAKNALDMVFQHEVVAQLGSNPKSNNNTASEFANSLAVRENLKYIEDGINDNTDDINFPNKSTLIISTLLSCLEDEKQMVKRNILDFMIFHLKINHQILTRLNQLVLVEGVLNLLIKKEVSVTRRVNVWLFGKPDMDNKYSVKKGREFVVDLIVEAFQRIFNFEPTDKIMAQQPLKIMQNFYMEHDHLVEATLGKLSISIVRYVYQHSQNSAYSADVLKSGKRFMENIANYFNYLLKSLGNEAIRLLSELKDEEGLEIIKLIEFSYTNLLGTEETFDVYVSRDCIKETLAGLFKSLEYIGQEQIHTFACLEPAMKVILKLLQKLDRNESKIKKIEKKEKKDNQPMSAASQAIAMEFDECAEKFFLFFERLSGELEKFKADNIYKICSQNLVKMQKFLLEKKNMSQLPQWFKCISQSIKIVNPNISLIAIESMIEIMISEKIDPVYEQLKILIIDEAKLKYSRKNEIVAGNDYTKLTLEKLWSLLDFQPFYDRIIDLIINFSKFFPQYFKEVVVNSFQTVSITEKEASIRRFAVFWRLTANHQSQVLLSELNKVGLFIMLDFLDHDNPLIRHASKNWLMESVPQFYRIIDPLFEVLLQANSSWYVTDNYQLFYTKIYETSRANETFRKLKSILILANDVFLNYISQYELSPVLFDMKAHFTDRNQAVLVKRIGASFSYFSTISMNQNSLDNSSFPNQGGMQFPQQASNSSSQSGGSSANNKQTELKMSYLDLLIIVCLRYIQGQALESLSLKFQIENAAVNASACEFMELMITHLADPPLCLALCEYLTEPLLTILGHCITNKDFVMQVQLLNVFRTIFFHSSYTKKNSIEDIKTKMLQTLSNKLFIPNLLKGLMISIPYVRSQFISFISACVPLLSTYLVHPQLTNIIKQIMFSYFSLIKHLSTTPAQENDDSVVTVSKTQIIKQTSLIKTTKTVMLIQTQEQVKEDSNIYEIHTVLEGVRTILQFYLKIRTLEEIEQTKKEVPSGFMNTMKSVLTFGIAGGQVNDKDKDGKVIFSQYSETCNCLLYDIKQVVELFINSWQTSPTFLVEFTSFGMRPYEQKKYNSFNSLLTDMIKSAENDKQKVKMLIISIIKPLVYEFPIELVNSFISLWNRECSVDVPLKHNDFVQNDFLKKMVEMLTILNIPNDVFLESLFQSFVSEKITAFYKVKNPKEKKNLYLLNYEIAQLETNLLFFLYIYLSYTFVDPGILKKENLLALWSAILKILKIFSPSKNPNTSMWAIDLLYMLSEKYSPKEILNDNKFKKDLHDLINEKLTFLSGWIAQSFAVKFNEPSVQTQIQLNNATDQHMKDLIVKNLQQYKIIAPYSPTIYELSLAFYSQIHILEHAPKNVTTQMKDLEITELDRVIFDKINLTEEQGLQDKYRLLILETVKSLSLELLQNTYSPERTDRVVSRVREFIEPLYIVIDNKTSQNTTYLESCSELICGLLEKAPTLLIKDFRRGILETFNKDNFFACNRKTLRFWGKIIDWVITHDKSSDLFMEYLDKVGLQAGFFAREGTENKRKIKSFKRICFVIFYGAKDKYKTHLRFLLDRISDVIKSTDNAHSSLLILILFCIRILILRLSQENLNDLFKQIWPMLLTLLIQIYSKPSNGQPSRNPNLMLAGLKLIEILSVAQLDEFYLHQWMFIFDYFGLKLQVMSLQERENLKKVRGQMTETQIRQISKISPFHFQPFVSTCLNEQEITLKYVNEQQHQQEIPEETVTYIKKQRKILITSCKVDDEAELKGLALALCQYLIQNNETRTEVNLKQIESLIEDDFINLDEFILKV